MAKKYLGKKIFKFKTEMKWLTKKLLICQVIYCGTVVTKSCFQFLRDKGEYLVKFDINSYWIPRTCKMPFTALSVEP